MSVWIGRPNALSLSKWLWPWLAAAASGVLLALTFAPWNQGWLIWVALVPLLCAVWFTPAKKPRAFLLGYVAGIVFYAGAFHWLASLGSVVSAPLLQGLPLLLSLYLGLYLGCWAWAMRALIPPANIDAGSSLRHLGIGALGACFMVALEWTRGWLLTGFGWDGLGVALHRDLAMIQVAELTGVLGLTWLVTFANVMAVVIVRRIRAEFGPDFLKRVRWEFSCTMLVISLVFSYGVRKLLHPPQAPMVALRVATIQPNVPQDLKFNEDAEDLILAKLKLQTEQAAAGRPNVILWPEAPAVRGMMADQANYDFMMGLAADGDYDLLIGSLDYELDPSHPDELLVYNAALHLTEHGAKRTFYRKMHLVPFGEYMPYRALMPAAINNLVSSDLKAGHEPGLFHLSDPHVAAAPLVCFEDTLGDLTRRTCLAGAQVLVNLTNDGWFQKTAGAQQHLDNAVFRSVENRRPLIRSTNTGMTGFVDAAGRWTEWLVPFEEGVRVLDIQVPAAGSPTTFYTRHGDWFAYLSSGLSVLWLGVRIVRRRRGCAREGLRSPVPVTQ
ncbi:MAG TPA: apolipoprotein N-acyltransferase [Chthoniobacteraceae bacterium]|jgi:apolipoprotein N-acyltransferase|nr:apolipoprotein N-acyltransferase [Chthoniobacteraceae bacterium]